MWIGKEQKSMFRSPFIPPAYLPHSTPVTESRPVAIDDLRLKTHRRGTYFMLGSVTPPSRITAKIRRVFGASWVLIRYCSRVTDQLSCRVTVAGPKKKKKKVKAEAGTFGAGGFDRKGTPAHFEKRTLCSRWPVAWKRFRASDGVRTRLYRCYLGIKHRIWRVKSTCSSLSPGRLRWNPDIQEERRSP